MIGLRPVELAPQRRLRPLERLSLTVEILWTYQRARRLMHTVDLPTALARLRGPSPTGGRPPGPQEVYLGQRLGRSVMLVLARLPTDKRCLIRSLVVSSLVARRDVPAALTIGVKPRESEPFMAHAWVEVDGTAIIPVEGYEPLHTL